jgi:small-conductance mechanosensitive channel
MNLEIVFKLFAGAAIIVAFILLAFFFLLSTKKYLTKPFEEKAEIKRHVVSTVRGSVATIIVLLGFLLAVRLWILSFSEIFPWWLRESYLILIIQLVFLVLVIKFISLISNSFLTVHAERIIKQRPEFEVFVKLLKRAINYSIYIIGICVAAYLVSLSPIVPIIGGEIFSSILGFLIGLTLTFLAVYLVNFILTKYIHELSIKEPKLTTLYIFLRRILVGITCFIGVTIVVFTVFPTLAGLVTSLLIAGGFISIILGLAAQSSLSNLISGMLIATSQPFRINDAVMFRNDYCIVEDIKLMHTVLRTWDNRRLIVPNSIFQSEVIINYSIGDPTMLIPIAVQVSYESDLEKAMNIMVEVARKHPDFLPTPGLPKSMVMEFADSGITLRLLSRAKDQPTAFMMARDLLFQIKKEFDANGIEIPYPRRFLVLDKRIEEKISKTD